MRTLSLLVALLARLMTDGQPDHRPQGVVVGTVTDAATGAPLSGVQIHVDGRMLSALSARDGGYTLRLASQASGDLTTRADLIGYRTSTRQVTTGADSLRIDFALESTRQQGLDFRSRDEFPFSTAEAMDAAIAPVGLAVRTVIPSRAVEAARVKAGGIPMNTAMQSAPGDLYRREFVDLVREAHELSTADESGQRWR
jgi:hypothetical protein